MHFLPSWLKIKQSYEPPPGASQLFTFAAASAMMSILFDFARCYSSNINQSADTTELYACAQHEGQLSLRQKQCQGTSACQLVQLARKDRRYATECQPGGRTGGRCSRKIFPGTRAESKKQRKDKIRHKNPYIRACCSYKLISHAGISQDKNQVRVGCLEPAAFLMKSLENKIRSASIGTPFMDRGHLNQVGGRR